MEDHWRKYIQAGIKLTKKQEVFCTNIKEYIEIILSISEMKALKNMKVAEGYYLFTSKLNGMCLKKFYTNIYTYLAIILMLVGIFLVQVITRLALSSTVSQSWEQIGEYNQELRSVHIQFFIDDEVSGSSIAMFNNMTLDMVKTMQTNLQILCPKCIAVSQTPIDFFNSMPYSIRVPIPRKFLINEIYRKKHKVFSFTYGLPSLTYKKIDIARGKLKKNKTLTIYYNSEMFHSSFRSLAFGHNLALM